MRALGLGKTDAVFFLLSQGAQGGRDIRSAFLDGSGEESLCGGRCNQSVGVGGAGRLSGNRNPRWIAAEGRDVVTHPLQCRQLVENSVIPRSVRLLGQRRMGEEAEYAEAVIEGDDHKALLRQILAVVNRN